MKIKHIALSFSLTLLLSACGGGGGGESASVDIDTDQSNTQTTSDLVSSVTQSDTQEDNTPKLIDNSSVALSMPSITNSSSTNPLEEIDR